MLRRKQSSETDPADWFFAAADRLRVADGTWERDGLTLTGIELLQEAVERYLKGYLIARGWSLDRTHDLRKLLSVAMTYDSAFNLFKPLADELTADFFAELQTSREWLECSHDNENCNGQRREQRGREVPRPD